MRKKGSKNLKTRIEEMEFETMIVKEKLKMIDDLNLDIVKVLETYQIYFEKMCEILEKLAKKD